MAGRLIFPSVVVLRFLNTVTMRSGAKYDDQFREPIATDSDGDNIGEPARDESNEVKVLAQIATRTFDRYFQAEHGRIDETPDLEATFHFRDLEKLGLVQADGRSSIQVGVRLERIENKAGDNLYAFGESAGMYVTAARPSGFMGPTRNLWVVTFSDRRQARGEPRPRQV